MEQAVQHNRLSRDVLLLSVKKAKRLCSTDDRSEGIITFNFSTAEYSAQFFGAFLALHAHLTPLSLGYYMYYFRNNTT
jgi:hypothetical protein